MEGKKFNECEGKKFNAYEVKNEIAQWIKVWFNINGIGCNAIIGISGGKDSSVVAALCSEALGRDRVKGILMPNLSQTDIEYSYKLIKHLGIDHYLAPITAPTADVRAQLVASGVKPSAQTLINLPARMRMVMLYAFSQSLNGRVVNTSNLSERWIGYSTRFGDGVGDLCPIAFLTNTEVIAVGRALGLPSDLVEKPPSDGLTGQTDEENFGFSYEMLDTYIRSGTSGNSAIDTKINDLHNRNMFKHKKPQCFLPNFYEDAFGNPIYPRLFSL